MGDAPWNVCVVYYRTFLVCDHSPATREQNDLFRGIRICFSASLTEPFVSLVYQKRGLTVSKIDIPWMENSPLISLVQSPSFSGGTP